MTEKKGRGIPKARNEWIQNKPSRYGYQSYANGKVKLQKHQKWKKITPELTPQWFSKDIHIEIGGRTFSLWLSLNTTWTVHLKWSNQDVIENTFTFKLKGYKEYSLNNLDWFPLSLTFTMKSCQQTFWYCNIHHPFIFQLLDNRLIFVHEIMRKLATLGPEIDLLYRKVLSLFHLVSGWQLTG